MSFYVARQPILKKDKSLFAYELLFRNGPENAFPDISLDEATQRLVEGSEFNSGIQQLTGNSLAFVNFTARSLKQRLPLLMPHDQIVVELLETITPTAAVVEAVLELKQKGYTIALDDFEYSDAWQPLIEIADIIKYDFQALGANGLKQQMDLLQGFSGVYLAEKIETHDEFTRAKEMGFSLFQGYFFARPEMVKSRTLNASQQIYTQLLSLVSQSNFSIPDVVKTVEKDTGMSFKLLRFANSAVYQRRQKVETLRQAIVFLGQKELQRFVAIIALSELGSGKPEELLKLSILRARFCEMMANDLSTAKLDPSHAFLTGLLSNLDAIMNDTIENLLARIAISEKISDALVAKKGPLAFLISLINAFERANWPVIKQACERLQRPEVEVANIYKQAADWVETLND
ncbi:EAL domain-containing protein [Idiomarina tyrosinivorans]|uniref:EAL domain-containing protein n=1 Tax=Idiomarina tyrosinivorans TaxID=1445662 RepID=A0A432ZRT4_9GAMM|nr:HDOD domain-containing protein [Idiomarina tyrosinivorans]RUO80620.1 EAL domain-containing protein [Idiomarina tyrosinivorans]